MKMFQVNFSFTFDFYPAFHFANTLAPIHTTVIWAYFGAKEIESSFDLLLTALSCVLSNTVDGVVHQFNGPHVVTLQVSRGFPR